MKLFITFIISLCFCCAAAQYRGAENNFYTYTEKDSVTTITNYVYGKMGNGAAVYWPYGGQIKILGSNYVKTLPGLINGNTINPGFQIPDSNLLWVLQTNRGFLFKDEILVDSFTSKGQIHTSFINKKIDGNELWFTYKAGNQFFVASYASGKLTEWGSPVFQIEGLHWFWSDKNHQLNIGNPSGYCTINNHGFGPVKNSGIDYSRYYFMGHDSVSNSFFGKIINAPIQPLRINENGTLKNMVQKERVKDISAMKDGVACVNFESNYKDIIRFTKADEMILASFYYPDIITCVTEASNGSYYIGSAGKMSRVFEYVKKYPKVFRNENAGNIFSIQQDSKGKIWAGSYAGFLSVIENEKVQEVPVNNLKISNGGCTINNKLYLIGEGEANGLLEFNETGQYRKLTKNVTGFFTYPDTADNKLYFGTSLQGLWYSAISDLGNSNIKWHVVNASQGLTLQNIVTIAKDKTGRLWLGQTGRGFAVYNPATNKAKTWLIEKNETSFGAMSSFTDSYGTVWLGSRQRGLLYYNNYRSDTVALSDISELQHPLLVHGKTITAIKQWGDWLLLGATDYYLAFNLKEWYASKKILMRYLNPQEAAFTNPTEQNTLLIDKRDSSVWFSTSDMLYQWDFKRWLSLPASIVQPNIEITIRNKKISLQQNEELKVAPTDNNIAVTLWFQAKDNMPRYMSVALVKDGDSLAMPPPSLQTRFSYQNLSSGQYQLVVQIFEQDGSTSTHTYPVFIKKFLWQQWWFWAIVAGGLVSIVAYLINLKRKKQIAEEQAKRISAEAEALKSEQNRQLTKMQVVSLSNQFRPHFILNALNTVGAQLYDKPEVDAVLGQLGDSIGIIFKNAQAGSIAHPLGEEWKLVESVINIKQMEYNHGVMVKAVLNGKEITMQELCGNTESINENRPRLCDTPVPMGIIQIPVENALIHGLRNKETGTQNLFIEVTNEASFLKITVTDNGIGRKAAALISNYRKNGVGTKNLMAVIELLNQYNTEKMRFYFEDDVFETNQEKHGTRVIIIIPKTFNYEIG